MEIAETYNTQLLELSLDEFGGNINLQPIATRCTNLRKLSLNYIDNPIMGMEYLIQGCTKLECLYLMGADICLFSYPPQTGITFLTCILTTSLDCFDLGLFPQYLMNLRELWINKLLNQQADFVKLLSEKSWPSLKLLSLGSFEYVHFPGI